MYRRYIIDGEETSIFVSHIFHNSTDGVYGNVSFYTKKNKATMERSIRKDENGNLFFTWNKKKIYLDSFLAYSPYEFLEKLNAADGLISTPNLDDELCCTLMKYGLDAFDVEDDDHKCVFDIYRHELDGYKFDLVDYSDGWRYDYYAGDFICLVKNGNIKMTVREKKFF